MITTQDIETIITGGGIAYSTDGEEIGPVQEIYLDTQSGEPSMARVSTGISATAESHVPLLKSTLDGSNLHLPYSKDQVKNAPHIDANGGTTPGAQASLYRYYSYYSYIDTNTGAADTPPTGAAGKETFPAPSADGMIRSEERLHVRTQRHATEKVRLRKYIVTEEVTLTVTLRHEEFRLEREPLPQEDREQTMEDPSLSEEDYEVILYAERPVISSETIPVERIRIRKQVITAEQAVTEEVRKELIDTHLTHHHGN